MFYLGVWRITLNSVQAVVESHMIMPMNRLRGTLSYSQIWEVQIGSCESRYHLIQPLEARIHVYTYFVYGESGLLGGGGNGVHGARVAAHGRTRPAQLIPLHVMLFLYSSLISVITLITSSYVNNTMAPNIEVQRIKPEKGNMGLLSRQYTLITLTSITIVSHTYAEGQTHLR